MSYDVIVGSTVVATVYSAVDQIMLVNFYRNLMREQGFTHAKVCGSVGRAA